MQIFLGVIMFFIGASIGSFADAAASRTVADKKWWGSERSRCDSCGALLSAFELIPVVSYAIQCGRCRKCGAKIALHVLFSELIGGSVLALASLKYGASFNVALISAMLIFLIFHSVTDYISGYIYDTWSIAMAFCGIAMRTCCGLGAICDGLYGAAAGFCAIAVIILLSRGKMGWGDATLAGGIGAFMGLKSALLSLYLGFLAGGITVLPLLITGRVTKKSEIALGPFLCLGAIIAFFTSEYILGFF